MTHLTKVSEQVRCMLPSPTPKSLGYRMPAEWEPHLGTWFSWPHNTDTWGRHLSATEQALSYAISFLCKGETVYINVLDEVHLQKVDDLLTSMGVTQGVQYCVVPTNDSWCRDHGAIFLTHPAKPEIAASDWGFNAWGGKYPPFALDNAVPRQMCDVMNAIHFATPFILEGGSIEVNGEGVLLTTASCLLHPNRNPGFSKKDVEWVLEEMLGVDHVIWLTGELEGDDTDGHIDNIARFVNPYTIVLARENPDAGNKDNGMPSNSARLEAAFNAMGMAIDLVYLPRPAPFFIEGRQLPASYINFYIGNEVVLMPVFDDPQDEDAQQILQSCFPLRRVIPVDCTSIIWGLGALHCLSQQVPKPINQL